MALAEVTTSANTNKSSTMVRLPIPVSGSIGNVNTVADDVWVDGKIITAENFDSASHFGW